jgi:hypothetical protein
MVPRVPYEAYVLSRANDADVAAFSAFFFSFLIPTQISTCIGFQALVQANTRFSKGLRYTGIGGVFCGRSEMVLPNGVGNLQKGERYIDTIPAALVSHLTLPDMQTWTMCLPLPSSTWP